MTNEPDREARTPSAMDAPEELPPWPAWAGSAAVVIAVSMAGLVFPEHLAEIAMGYVLAIVIVSARWGRAPALFAAVLGAGLFGWAFVPPRFTFAVSDPRLFVTFVVLLAVSLIVGSLTARIRAAADGAARREKRMSALYALGRELSRAQTLAEVAAPVARHVESAVEGKVVILLEAPGGRMVPLAGEGTLAAFDSQEHEVARWVLENRKPAGFATATRPGAIGTYLPLRADAETRGVVGVLAPEERLLRDPDRWAFFEAACDLAGLAIERVRLARAAYDADLRVRSEQTRSALLSSVSHDLRTPLATITGSASALLAAPELDAGARRELAGNIVDESRRLDRLVGNLLDMTRLQTGAEPRREWVSIVEITDATLRRLDAVLAGRIVSTTISRELPMIEVDEVLIGNALGNLLENAVKHTPASSPISIEARIAGDFLVVDVLDRGPGIPPGDEDRVFEKFFRASDGHGGAGLGLTIVRAIVEAHGGRVSARNREGGGADFRMELPRGRELPPVPQETGGRS